MVLLRLFITLLMFVFSYSSLCGQTHQLATYNIRFDNPGDQGNLWKDRFPHLISLLKFHEIGIIGTQEGLFHQLEEMKDALKFAYIGVGRDDGAMKGEFSAIFYDPNRYELLASGHFWLSESTDRPSKGWDAAMNRICTFGKFKTSDGQVLWIFNAHYDHIGQLAREKSSQLVKQKIREVTSENEAVIYMGDLNVTPDNLAYTTVLEGGSFNDSKLVSILPPHGPDGTFNAFDWNLMPNRRIDYVFVNKQVVVQKYAVLTDNYGKKYPSDHFPVMVCISLN